MIVFAILIALLGILGLAIFGLVWFFRKLIGSWDEWSWGKRCAFVGTGVIVITSPYLLFKVMELRFVLARVPEPLHISWIEYREEKAWGIGLPGDNETGFVVYRLTDESAGWARRRGDRLAELLPGGSQHWQLTPVADWADGGRNWHAYDESRSMRPHAADIREYLDKYGFGIPIEPTRAEQLNHAIRTTGSFYSYGHGGSITVVDPRYGKVYFAYAG